MLCRGEIYQSAPTALDDADVRTLKATYQQITPRTDMIYLFLSVFYSEDVRSYVEQLLTSQISMAEFLRLLAEQGMQLGEQFLFLLCRSTPPFQEWIPLPVADL